MICKHVALLSYVLSFAVFGTANGVEGSFNGSLEDSPLSASQLRGVESALASIIDLERSSLDVPKTLIEARLTNDQVLLKRVLLTKAGIELERDVLTLTFRLVCARGDDTFVSHETTVNVSGSESGEAQIESEKGDPLGFGDDRIKGLEAAKKMLQAMGFDPAHYSASRYAKLPISSVPKGATVTVKAESGTRIEDTNFIYTTRIQKETTLEIRVELNGKAKTFTRVILPAESADPLVVSFE